MATNIVEQLKNEIKARRSELAKLESALQALGGTRKARSSSGATGTRKPRTEEQKAAQAERMKKIWAAKKAAGGGKKAAPRKRAAAKKEAA